MIPKTDEFVLPHDVVELQTRIRSIKARLENAIAGHDFAQARMYSDEEAKERDKLILLYRQHGLLNWIYE
jgi:hypothetical protein